MSPPELHLFTRSDLADLEISPAEVISAVREGYLALANGASRCPTKLMMHYRLYATERGSRPLIGVAPIVSQSTPQCRSRRSR
jgi:hypothetical protein